ncbi:hypothetical protein H2248_009832 [Termitomyces sp. 'cryptogamus']|nr:hypothetical protein H2248_009832 [Termitomyces sp. 'cryptogamus']
MTESWTPSLLPITNMQLFSFLERRRSTAISPPAKTELNAQDAQIETLARSSMLVRSASLLKAKLTGTRTKRTASPSGSGRPVSYFVKTGRTPNSESWRYSASFVDFETSHPKRKSSLKRLLQHMRSSSREERLRAYDQEELIELAYLLELKETESVQSVTAKRNTRVCQGNYRRSREVEIIDPYTARYP